MAASADLSGRNFWLVWGSFCTLMLLVALQEALFEGSGGSTHWRWPLFDELLALALATGVAVWRRRLAAGSDALLHRPGSWFMRTLAPLVWVAPAFVLLLYGLRHAARGALGDVYLHAPWPVVMGYECTKFGVFYLLLAGVDFGQRSHRALMAERLRAARLEQLSVEARLQQMTQQMQPHFLFNALNTIAGLLHDDARAADTALTRLAALLRAAIDATATPQQRWAQELALARDYAGLMAQRFGPRVQLHWHDEPALADWPVPTLSLQPLLENCFVHGVEQQRGPVHIGVQALMQDDCLMVVITDDATTLALPVHEGVGLSNLRQRLHALHGGRASITLSPRAPRGVVARLVVPRASP